MTITLKAKLIRIQQSLVDAFHQATGDPLRGATQALKAFDDSIDQIDQAYRDEGFVQGVHWENQEKARKALGYLTRQEWFKKFDDELKVALVAYPEHGDEEAAHHEYWRIRDIAKKAAGIE